MSALRSIVWGRSLATPANERAILLTGCAFTLFAWLPGEPFRPDQFVLPKEGFLGVFAALALLLRSPSPRTTSTTTTLLVVLAMVWAALSASMVAVNQDYAWHEFGRVCAATGMFVAARGSARTAKERDMVLNVLLALCSVQFIAMSAEAFGVIEFFSERGRRPGAMLGNRNVSARLACLILPFLWRRCIEGSTRRDRLITAAQVALASICIVLSRSRGAWLVAGIGFLALPAMEAMLVQRSTAVFRTSAIRIWAIAIAVALSTALLPSKLGWTTTDFGDSLSRIVDIESGTGRGRIQQLRTTVRMIRGSWPLGVGAGNWSIAYPEFAEPGDASVDPAAIYPTDRFPRGDVLGMLAELGLPGLLIGVALLWRLLRNALALLRGNLASSRRIGVTSIAVTGVALALAVIEPVFRSPPTLMLLAVVTGVLRHHRDNAELAIVSHLRDQVALRGLAILGACWFAASTFSELAATHLLRNLRSPADLNRAVRLAPNNAEVRFTIGLVLARSGYCSDAAPHLRVAAALQPHSGAVNNLLAACRRDVPR